MLATLVRHTRKRTTHPTHATHASTPPTQVHQPRCTPYATHAIHARGNNTPFLKLVYKFPPLKNCQFQNIDLYFNQKIIIVKRHLQVYVTCHSKCRI